MAKTMAVLISLLVVGCGPASAGEACDLLGNTLCERCFPQEKSDCLAGFFSTCCRGSTCEQPVRDSGKVLECNAQLKTIACSSVSQGNVPAVCRGVTAP